MNYTYILQCADSTYYTGWTNNLEKRLIAHNSGKGAKYTRPIKRRPVKFAYYEVHDAKEKAMSREAHIKKLSRIEKEELIKHFDKRRINTLKKLNELVKIN